MFNVTKLLNQENITLIPAVIGTLKDIRLHHEPICTLKR